MGEAIGTALSSIMSGIGGGLVGFLEAFVKIFWTPGTGEASGSLTVLGVFALISLAMVLIRFGVGFVIRLIKSR